MSNLDRWEKYKINSNISDNSLDKWDKYKVMPNNSEQATPEGDSWPALIGKSALKGVTGIASLPKAIGSLTEGANNLALEYINPFNMKPTNYSSHIPDFGAKAQQGLEDLTGLDLEPHPQDDAQRIVSHAAEFAGGAGPLGAIGKGIKWMDRFAKAGKITAGAAGVGATSGVLQEAGVDPLIADTTAILAPSPRTILKLPGNITRSVMGLSPKKLNIKAAQAAQDLGIEMPATALTDSTLTGLADQWVNKFPIHGDVLKSKYAKTQEQTLANLENILEKVGPQKSADIETQINKLYQYRKNSLPKKAAVAPTNTLDALKAIEFDSSVLAPETTSLLKTRDKIYKDILKNPDSFPVSRLIGTKQQLNKLIKWDTDEGIKNLLRNVQHGISEDIKEYGKINPRWYEGFKQADDMYASVAKREDLQHLLHTKTVDPLSNELSYNAFARNTGTRENLKFIEKRTDPETFEKIKKLSEVSKAMALKNRRIPNPSGTATTLVTIGFITSLYTNPIETLSGGGISALIGASAASRLLTNKKLINSALKAAEKPNQINVMAVNSQLKKITGYSAPAIVKLMQDMEN